MSQKWFQSKCTKGFAALFVLCAQAQAAPSPLPRLLQEVEARYAKGGTLTAQFNQTQYNATTQSTKKSKGTLQLARPNRFRWDTLTPDPNSLVSDGEKVWFYTPPFDEGEHGQVIEKPAKSVKTELASAILAGSLSTKTGELKVKEAGPHLFEVSPRKAGAAGTVERVLVDVDPKLKQISKLTVHHKGGNRSEISLEDVKLGSPIEASVFEFKAPPNTDRIKE